MEKVEWGWVVMGEPHGMNQWKKNFHRWVSRVHLINNKKGEEFGMPGSNAYFEFSGYLELIAQMQTEGPYILANDTWFKTHNRCLWRMLLRQFLVKAHAADSIFGDIRTETSAFSEKPSPYLSSWIFYIPNKALLMQFKASLERAIELAHEANFSDGYKSYVEDWLNPKNPWYGWHMDSQNSEVLERKRRCIYIEHQLNLQLIDAQLSLKSLGYQQRRLYFVLRWVDRLQTRLHAWRLFRFT
jgi:hypothetical protein